MKDPDLGTGVCSTSSQVEQTIVACYSGDKNYDTLFILGTSDHTFRINTFRIQG
jgi:hypothetical protein